MSNTIENELKDQRVLGPHGEELAGGQTHARRG